VARTVDPFASPTDARPALLAVAIAHQAHIAAERAATVRAPRQARAARRAEEALAGALAQLERLVLPDRAARLANQARHASLAVPGTVVPAERAWALAWHLLVAGARLHVGATEAGRPVFGERATAEAVALTRRALRALECLVSADRRLELRAALEPAALRLDAQLALFGPALAEPLLHGWRRG
jgi:hypothetical protein